VSTLFVLRTIAALFVFGSVLHVRNNIIGIAGQRDWFLF